MSSTGLPSKKVPEEAGTGLAGAEMGERNSENKGHMDRQRSGSRGRGR